MEDSGKGRGPAIQPLASDHKDAAARQDGDREARSEEGSGLGLSDHTQKRIGLHLRAMYDTIVQQPVPDRFRDLIAQLDTAGAASPRTAEGPAKPFAGKI